MGLARASGCVVCWPGAAGAARKRGLGGIARDRETRDVKKRDFDVMMTTMPCPQQLDLPEEPAVVCPAMAREPRGDTLRTVLGVLRIAAACGLWITLRELTRRVKLAHPDPHFDCEGTSISARLRDLRNRYGFVIETRKRPGSKAYEYRLFEGIGPERGQI